MVDPWLAGFTTIGSFNLQLVRTRFNVGAVPRHTTVPRGTGMPSAASSVLVTTLCMPTALARTPDPV